MITQPNVLNGDALFDYKFKTMDVGKSLPKQSANLLTEYIPNNRQCNGIDAGFCFWDTKSAKNINYEQNGEFYEKLIGKSVSTMNNLTGNGQWQCVQYEPSDFVITLYLENESG